MKELACYNRSLKTTEGVTENVGYAQLKQYGTSILVKNRKAHRDRLLVLRTGEFYTSFFTTAPDFLIFLYLSLPFLVLVRFRRRCVLAVQAA